MGRFVVGQDGNLVTCDLCWANSSLRDPDQWHVNALWCSFDFTEMLFDLVSPSCEMVCKSETPEIYRGP